MSDGPFDQGGGSGSPPDQPPSWSTDPGSGGTTPPGPPWGGDQGPAGQWGDQPPTAQWGGSAPGTGGGAGQAPPSYPPQPPAGYPPQGYGPQGHPPQGYGPQGYPPQGYGPQGYPPHGYGPQAGGLAEWWQRLVALLIDGFVLSVPLGILYGILIAAAVTTVEVDPFTGEPNFTDGGAVVGAVLLFFLVAAVAPLVYSALMEGGRRGATLGKMAMKIRVVDATTGGPIGIGKAFLRRLIYAGLFWLFFIPGLINGLSPLWDARRQAWHDKAVNSVVVSG